MGQDAKRYDESTLQNTLSMKQKGPFRSLAFLGGLLALAAVCASSAADPGGSPQNSNFADTSTWVRCMLGSGVQLTPAGNGFEADYAAEAQPDAKGDICAGYFSTFALRGDFTLDIDYTLTTWPASSGVRLGLVLWPSICMIRQGQGPSTQEWHTFGGGPYANIPTDDRQGTLRLVRKGGELLGYYLTGGTWVLVGSRTGDPVFTNDFQVFVHSWTASSDFGRQAVGIRLSNFVMTADTVLPGPYGAPSWTTTPPPVPATPVGHWTTGPTMEQSFEARVPSTLYSLLAPRAASTMEQSVEARVPSAPAVQPLESAAVLTGILEEDLNLDLNAAIQSYQSLVSQFDAQRPLAANAIFRMAECYRRLGRMEEARSQYARILREFADQAPLLRLSRKYAANPTTIMPPPNLLPAPHLPAQGSVTGTWKAEEVAFAPWTFTLKAEGAKVTGTVSQGGSSGAMITTLTGATAIYDGAIEGNKVSFKCDSPDGGRTVSFSGVVAGDIITFTRQVNVQPGRFPGMNGIYGASGATHFTAKRLGTGSRYAGQMDEVGLYNRGLSAAEIRAAYAAGSLGKHGLPATAALQPTLVNINFAATNPIEVGFAATGLSANDYWNGFTKPYQAFAGLGNLKAADGTPTAIGMTVRNGAGNWYFNYPGVDVMYGTYCYAQDLGDVTVTVTNLPGGQYDFYLYGHGGADNANTLFELRVGENGYGLRSTATNSDWSLTHWAEPAPGRRGLQQDAPGKNVTHWVEGAQYVVYRRVAVAGGGAPVTIIAHPGLSGYTHINGMQIARSTAPAMAAMSLPTYQFLPGPHPTEGTAAPEWQQEQAPSPDCADHLKEIGIAFKTWALDHNDQFPFNVSTNSGGTLELCARRADGYDRNAALHFRVMANELSTPRILICPNDSSKGRSPASDFRNLQPANVTYLLHTGPDVNDTNPEAVLVVCPLCKNVLLVDGSVQRRPGIQTGPPLPAEGTSP